MDSCNLAAAETEKEAEKPEKSTTDPSSYSYEGETYVYTDSATGFQYKWDVTENKWIPKESSAVNDGNKSESSNEPAADHKYEIVGNTYMYKDEKTGRILVWDLETKQWKPKAEDTGEPVQKKKKKRKRGSDEEFNTSDESEDEEVLEQRKQNMNFHVFTREDGVKYYKDPADGTIYEWDVEKRAWFPNLDEEFLARYQMSYGVDPSAPLPPVESTSAPEARPEPKPKKSDKPAEPSWFQVDDTHNTKVYVSGLPTDVTEKEFIDFMQKCGLVEKDLQTGQMKIKLYKEADGTMKGDALCTYIKVFIILSFISYKFSKPFSLLLLKHAQRRPAFAC